MLQYGLIGGLVAVIAQAVTLWLYKRAKDQAAAYKARGDALSQLHQAAKEEIQALQAEYRFQLMRKDANLAMYRREILALEADLEKCDAPGLVLDRVRRMFAETKLPPKPTK